MEKTWTDQPDEVLQADIVAHSIAVGKTHHAEIRKRSDDGRYYLTIGTLFGSQTIVADNADVAWVVLNEMTRDLKYRGENRKIPAGARLLS